MSKGPVKLKILKQLSDPLLEITVEEFIREKGIEENIVRADYSVVRKEPGPHSREEYVCMLLYRGK